LFITQFRKSERTILLRLLSVKAAFSLTPTLFRWERECLRLVTLKVEALRPCEGRTSALPLPAGEGWGEGEGTDFVMTVRFILTVLANRVSFLLIPPDGCG
jgi:hypothetical protein